MLPVEFEIGTMPLKHRSENQRPVDARSTKSSGMNDLRIRKIDDLPSSFSHANAVIGIFLIQIKLLIKVADRVADFFSNHHARSRHSANLSSFILVQMAEMVSCEKCIIPEDSVQLCEIGNNSPRR